MQDFCCLSSQVFKKCYNEIGDLNEERKERFAGFENEKIFV